MKNIYFTLVFLLPMLFFGQSKNSNSFRLTSSSSHDLYIRFDNGLIVDKNEDFTTQAITKITSFKVVQKEFNIQLKKGIPLSDEQFLEMENKEMLVNKTSEKTANLRSIFKIEIDNPTNENLYNLGLQLQKLKGVVYCSLLRNEPIKPPSDIFPTTSNYQSLQGYIGANPGVNMQYAWDNLQTGTGITIRDVEYGINVNHEEFADGATSIATGMTINSDATTDYTEHGTAVFGIVYANKGTYGVSGLAYGADAMILYPEWQQSGYDRVNAVTQAISDAEIGDVVIYEMQEYGENDNFVCAEYNELVWDLTAAGTATGVVIVAAAGNGNQNLDALFYADYIARGDSGAIIVGAGSSNSFHNKLSFSTYGSRVDVQGWGQNVYTTGYFADFPQSFKVGNDFNQSYLPNFNGTSAATPIVASCAAVLQSYNYSLSGNFLTSLQLRSILQQTGYAQTNTTAGAIGPFPNMQTAMSLVYNNYLLDVKNNNKPTFSIAPNPATNVLNVVTSTEFGEGSVIIVFNNLGQKMLTTYLKESTKIDISNFAKGVYFVQISSKNGFSATQKIIKQ